jgi:hypothetical protein
MAEKDSVFEVIASKLQLDEMYGQILASLFMLAQLLPSLVEAGVLSRERADAMINGASVSLDVSFKAEADSDPARSDTSTVMKYAKAALEDFRKALSDDNETSETAPESLH